MANEDLFHIKPKCIICTVEIPPERLRFKAVTCCDEHAKIHARIRRIKDVNKYCLFCHKPSTPNVRRSFSRFRQWERAYPELARPEEWAIVSAAGMTSKEFGKAIFQAYKNDVELDCTLRNYAWGRVKKQKGEAKPTPELDRCLEILAAYIPPPEKESTDAHTQTADLQSSPAE